MSGNDIADLDVTVGTGGGAIADGDTVTGEIVETGTHVWENPDGDDVLYFDIRFRDIETDFNLNTGFSLGNPDNPEVTPTTQLGGLLMEMGHDLAEGESVNLGDVFEKGDRFDFEVSVEEDAWTDNEGNLRDNFDPIKETVRPEGADAPELADGGSVESVSQEDEVLEIIEEHEGESERSVKAAILSENGDYLSTYKQMLEDGTVVKTDDDEIIIS